MTKRLTGTERALARARREQGAVDRKLLNWKFGDPIKPNHRPEDVTPNPGRVLHNGPINAPTDEAIRALWSRAGLRFAH